MSGEYSVGPDLVICGAARAGTSFLASWLGRHPQIDPGAVKEPNFYSRELSRGLSWYDGLYQPRRDGLLRLDGSMSYTFPEFPDALGHLAQHSPAAVMLYVVRDPLRRMLSHYQLAHHYFRKDTAESFGDALRHRDVYAGSSDYGRWLTTLHERFPEEQVLVLPFDVVTDNPAQALEVVSRVTGLDPSQVDADETASERHRNEVVEFRYEFVRKARRYVYRSGAYPWLRRTIGTDRLRRVRGRLTKRAPQISLAEALSTCDRTQLEELQSLYVSAQGAAAAALKRQDDRLGLTWAEVWDRTCPPGGSPDLSRELETHRCPARVGVPAPSWVPSSGSGRRTAWLSWATSLPTRSPAGGWGCPTTGSSSSPSPPRRSWVSCPCSAPIAGG